jgi:hypothetical protein
MGRDKAPSALFLTALLVLGMPLCSGPADAQTVDCSGTLASWQLTHPDYAKNCRCERSNQLPVCEGGSSTPRTSPSSKGRQTNKDFQRDLVKGVIQNILQNALSPQQSGPSPEEIRRKQEEEEAARMREQEARKLREAEERERQKIFERNKGELLQTMKGANSTSGLKLKGGGEETALDLKPASESRQTDGERPRGRGGSESGASEGTSGSRRR